MVHTKKLFIGAAIAVASLALSGCASNTSGQVARTAPNKKLATAIQGQSGDFWAWWNQPVVRYKNANAYFATQDRLYYWYEDGIWHQGKELPRWITPDRTKASFTKRARLLTASGNEPTVIAFNPHYVPYTPAEETAEQFADAPETYPTNEDGSVTFMPPAPADDEAFHTDGSDDWSFIDAFEAFTTEDDGSVTLVEED